MTTFRPRIAVEPTPDQEQIILGSNLGDGTLGSPNRCGTFINSHLRIAHTAKQKEYIQWKQEQLQPFSYPVHSLSVKEKRGNNWGETEREVLYFNCAASSYFTSLRQLWYPDGKKVFILDNVKHMNWLGLAVWYMDDGTRGFSHGSEYGFLSTEGFGIDIQPTIRDFLQSQFGLLTTIVSTGHGLTKIRLSASAMRILKKELRPHVIPSMLYKLGF